MRIEQAAILYDGVIYTLPRPSRHSDVMAMLGEANGRWVLANGAQGFTTNEGGFVDRIVGAKIAREAGQIIARRDGHINTDGRDLFSEDLW
jgi:hypothetical protein